MKIVVDFLVRLYILIGMITTLVTITKGRTAHDYRITQIEHGMCDEFVVCRLDTGAIYQTTLDTCTCPSYHYRGSFICKHLDEVRRLYLEFVVHLPLTRGIV